MAEKSRRRRSPGEGGLRERGAGAWEIKFDLGKDPGTGKRRFQYVTVKGSKKQALDKLSTLRHQRQENTLLDPTKIKVSVYLENWLSDHAQHRVSAKTFERYAEIIHTHIVPRLGDLQLTKLTPAHIQACQGALLVERRKRVLPNGTVQSYPPLSAHTVKHTHRILSQALKQAVRLRLIPRNPAEDVDPPRPVRSEMNILDQAQTGILVKAAEGTAIYIPVLIAVTTGMRRGEVLALRWRNLDLDARSPSLSVSQTLEETKGGLRFKSPKTDRSRRTITLPQLTVEELKRHRVRQAEERLRIGKAYADQDLVCCDALGKPIPPHFVTDAFSDLAARLKFPVRFHDLRHTHISHLLAAGVHPKVVSERAGHASVSITLDVYSHLIPGMQEDAAKRIDDALRLHLEPRS